MRGRGMKKMKKFKIDYVDRGGTEVSSAMQGLFNTVINSRGGRRFAGLLVPALMVLALTMVFAPSSAYAAGSNNLESSSDSSSGTVKTGQDVLMMTVTTSSSAQGADLTKAILTLSGTGLTAGDVNAVIANADGVEDGRVSPSSITNFSVNLNGTTLGGETWTFYINLKDSTVGITNLQLTLTALNGSDNPVGIVPKTTQENTVVLGCQAVAPSDVTLQSKTDTSITIKWKVNSKNAKYVLYRNAGGGYKLYNGNVPLSENPYTDWGIGASNALYPLTKYGFKIRGYDGTSNACESGDSNILITQTKSDNKFQIYTCGGCHTTPPDDAPLTRGTPDGGTIGRHANPYHTGGVMEGVEVCVKCHKDHTEPAHRDKKIAMNTVAIFGYPGSFYDKNNNYETVSTPEEGIDNDFAQTNLPIHVDNVQAAYPTGNGACVNTWCHGSRGASPVWGYSSGRPQCNLCHGMSEGTDYGFDTEGDAEATDEQMGAHNKHLHLGNYVEVESGGFLNISSVNPCGECHLTPSTHESSGHYDTADPAEVVFGPIATNGDVLNPTYNNTTGVCSNTYCHDGTKFKNQWSTAEQVNVPTWFDDTYLDDGGSTANCMNKCHGFPPAGDHDPSTDCSDCHEHMEANDYTYKPAYYYKHIDGVVQGLDCSDCHGTPPTDEASMTNTPALGRSGRVWSYPSTAWGAHSAHSTASVGCGECHDGGKPSDGQHNTSQPTDINMGFIKNGKSGEYTAPAVENATSYILNDNGSTTVTISGSDGAPRTCHNIY
jgi:predicted CxxxxCH...CXXCH cytochrome family protein